MTVLPDIKCAEFAKDQAVIITALNRVSAVVNTSQEVFSDIAVMNAMFMDEGVTNVIQVAAWTRVARVAADTHHRQE